MNNNINETINVDVDTMTLNIPVRVKMISTDGAPFDFTPSIDEVGQIVLTPVNKTVEFSSIVTEEDCEQAILELATITCNENDVATCETTICIQASMLCETSTCTFGVDIDEIGQAVIYPVDKENTFVTAAVQESLNLVTEDLKSQDYFGYKLVNTGDGWDVLNPVGEIVDEGVATEAEAKVLILTTELKALEPLVESTQEETAEEETADVVPEATAEVIDEATVVEELDKTTLITRFLQGDVPLFSDDGKPEDSYVHLSELDANGFSYYYDEETDAIVSYPAID